MAGDPQQPPQQQLPNRDGDVDNDGNEVKRAVMNINRKRQPLASRMRPKVLADVTGHRATVGAITLSLQSQSPRSFIFWGPTGCGKTTLALCMKNTAAFQSDFIMLSATNSGVTDVKAAVDAAKKKLIRTILFIDEIHRFSKSQQDSLLPAIEDGSIIFIGATTENPSFSCNSALLSRCNVQILQKLSGEEIAQILSAAINDTDRGVSIDHPDSLVMVDKDAIDFISATCEGDSRVALNALEAAVQVAKTRIEKENHNNNNNNSNNSNNNNNNASAAIAVTKDDCLSVLQKGTFDYDRAGDQHYDHISALHKSMRGGDVNAALYYLARMLAAGDQPLYIARRLVRFASEDVGVADPTALPLAVATHQACHVIGMPECDVILAHCVAHLALANKSIQVYETFSQIKAFVKSSHDYPIPMHIRNAPTKLLKDSGWGAGYIYTPLQNTAEQRFLPDALGDKNWWKDTQEMIDKANKQ